MKVSVQWSAAKSALPPNVHLLTLEQWEGRYFLLRLEHFYAIGEDTELSKPATVNLMVCITQLIHRHQICLLPNIKSMIIYEIIIALIHFNVIFCFVFFFLIELIKRGQNVAGYIPAFCGF